jgi:hypothetical protein
MELVRFDEQSYQLELQAYQIVFPDFKYEPMNLCLWKLEPILKF